MSRGAAAVEIGRSMRSRHVSEKREVDAVGDRGGQLVR